jgi:hypothetical protein
MTTAAIIRAPRMGRAWRRGWMAFVLVGIAASCTTPATQIVIAIDTDLGVPCDLDAVEVELVGATTRVLPPIAATELPTTVTVVPGPAREIRVRVRAMREEAERFVVEGTVAFEEDRSLLLPVVLAAACLDAPCASPAVAPFGGSLPPAETRPACDRELDAGVPVDGCMVSDELCNGVDEDCDDAIDEEVTDCEPSHVCRDGRCARRVAAYAISDTNTVAMPVSACDQGSPTVYFPNSSDEEETSVPLPFPFTFYGDTYETMVLSTWGHVRFGEAPPAPLLTARAGLDSESRPGPAAYVLFDRLRTRAAGVCVSTQGVDGAQQLVITWDDLCFARQTFFCDGGDRLTFHLVLDEATGSLDYFYETMRVNSAEAGRENGLTATIGLKGPDAPACSTADCGRDGMCGEPSADVACGYSQVLSWDGSLPLTGWAFVPAD